MPSTSSEARGQHKGETPCRGKVGRGRCCPELRPTRRLAAGIEPATSARKRCSARSIRALRHRQESVAYRFVSGRAGGLLAGEQAATVFFPVLSLQSIRDLAVRAGIEPAAPSLGSDEVSVAYTTGQDGCCGAPCPAGCAKKAPCPILASFSCRKGGRAMHSTSPCTTGAGKSRPGNKRQQSFSDVLPWTTHSCVEYGGIRTRILRSRSIRCLRHRPRWRLRPAQQERSQRRKSRRGTSGCGVFRCSAIELPGICIPGRDSNPQPAA